MLPLNLVPYSGQQCIMHPAQTEALPCEGVLPLAYVLPFQWAV